MPEQFDVSEEDMYFEYLKNQYLRTGQTVEQGVIALLQIVTDPTAISAIRAAEKNLKERIRKRVVIRAADTDLISADLPPIWAFGGKRWNLAREALVKFGFSEEEIVEVDNVTDVILNNGLEPPGKMDFTPRRGLVLGHVQSGKTTNFISLIAKAADSGYKLIVVLTGITDNLRIQTQMRIEERLLIEDKTWCRLTTMDSDFSAQQGNAAFILGNAYEADSTAIAVIKKNSARLRSFINWLGTLDAVTRASTPILIIDDEADQATPDVGKKKQSVINGLIENIADPRFMPRNVYIGYTATPFANFLIDGSTEKSLYPRDFIYPLKPGKGYFGAAELFGRDAVDEKDNEISPELRVLREISEREAILVRANAWNYEKALSMEKDYLANFPDNPRERDQLLTSILWFVLATGCRWIRDGKRNFSTMLIHTSSSTNAHQQTRMYLDPLFKDLKDPTEFNQKLLPLLEGLWKLETNNRDNLWLGAIPAWKDLQPYCQSVAKDLEIKIDNHKSLDRISYSDSEPFPRPPKIVIGGNTLSRGLTLEGLVTSYFLRSSNQYDSVLQMGRWFGYRRGYEDLQRIFMPNYKPEEFMEWFRALALVEADIRLQIQNMHRDGIKPNQVPVRIRTHPYLAITSAAKSRNAVTAQISFSRQRKDVTRYPLEPESLKSNLDNAKEFASQLVGNFKQDDVIRFNEYPLFKEVPAELIITFLSRHIFIPDAKDISGTAWINYINRAQELKELEFWNVFFCSPKRGLGANQSFVKDLSFAKVIRARKRDDAVYATGTLSNRPDILTDAIRQNLSPEALRSVAVKDASDVALFDLRAQSFKTQEKKVPGLLGIYLIDKTSSPINPDPRNQDGKIALNSPHDILGISAFFPKSSSPNLAANYITLDTSKLRTFEEDEDIDKLIEEAEALDEAAK